MGKRKKSHPKELLPRASKAVSALEFATRRQILKAVPDAEADKRDGRAVSFVQGVNNGGLPVLPCLIRKTAAGGLARSQELASA
jgi:hypothetical protein